MRKLFLSLMVLGMIAGCGGGSNQAVAPATETAPPANPVAAQPPGLEPGK
ncbi:MAG: hypothetical protein ACKO2P_10060 [Planctomycetota bacterium]